MQTLSGQCDLALQMGNICRPAKPCALGPQRSTPSSNTIKNGILQRQSARKGPNHGANKAVARPDGADHVNWQTGGEAGAFRGDLVGRRGAAASGIHGEGEGEDIGH